jgi:Uma2 family endonuclease
MADTAAARTMTADDLLRLPTGMGARYELVEGELKTMSPAGSLHGRIMLRLGGKLEHFVRTHALGETFGAETGFVLHRSPDTVRAPDVAFVARAHVPATGVPIGYFPVAPDLAVEVVSPSDTAAEVQQKVDDYFKAGSQQVWVVYPDQRSVAVYRSAGEMRYFAAEDVLDGGPLLPGFTSPVAEIFE